MNPLVTGGVVVGALLLFGGGKAAARVIPAVRKDDDMDALADMLITETNFSKSPPEMAQIVWIAANRARSQNKPMWFVVQPGAGPRPVWNMGPLYRKRFEEARNNPKWQDARAFAQRVLAGAHPNLGKRSFVHPQPMPTPPCAANRVLTQTGYGQRCLPDWIQGGQQIGTAWFA